MRKRLVTLCTAAVVAGALFVGCSGNEPNLAELRQMSVSKVHVERTYFKDAHGRYIHFNGVNLGGSTKVPYTVDPLSYIGRPFPLAEADKHFAQIKDMGFNSIRLLWMWEAVEPDEKGVYDSEFLDYFEKIIAKAGEHGLYVLINLHENLFSRHIFVRYNENTDNFYKRYCRDNAAGKADWSRVCQKASDCDPDETCDTPKKLEKNLLVDSFLATLPDFDRDGAGSPLPTSDPDSFFSDRVAGDGAPFWAVKACLPEKNLEDRAWGQFKALGQLAANVDAITGMMDSLSGGDEAAGPEMDMNAVTQTVLKGEAAQILPGDVEQGNDLMPWTLWLANSAISADVQRCYASYFAGDVVFPKLRYEMPDGRMVSVKEYLQSSVAGCWVEIAKRASKYDNVIGYDLMNEPLSAFVGLAAVAAMFQGGTGAVEGLLTNLLGPEMGGSVSQIIFGLQVLPPVPARPSPPEKPEVPVQTSGETKAEYDVRVDAYEKAQKQYQDILVPQYEAKVATWTDTRDDLMKRWGLEGADLMGILGLFYGFDETYLQPLYERIGQAIVEVDPTAIIWIEESMGLNAVLGESRNGFFEMNMTRPAGLDQVVFAPHWYPDIYPLLGFNVDPRQFTAEEWEYRDWVEPLTEKAAKATYSLGNLPVVYGEFGTYFNYNGIDWSVENDYIISEQILDNYYEAFEELGASRMVWCYTADNDKYYGDHWNHEDFSVLGFDGEPRGRRAYDRPFARALAGKLISTHFFSGLHYYDPQKGIADPYKEFALRFESKETDAPTEIHVPTFQYEDGFYVWLSDGYALYDHEDQTLYYFPTADEPGHVHEVVIRPPQTSETSPGDVRDNRGWRYFFRGDELIERTGGDR